MNKEKINEQNNLKIEKKNRKYKRLLLKRYDSRSESCFLFCFTSKNRIAIHPMKLFTFSRHTL